MCRNVRGMSLMVVLASCWLLVGQTLAQQASPGYEVWAADQNGNIVYILDPDGKVLRMIDGTTLGEAKRPHMLWGVPRDEFVYSTNTVSNLMSGHFR
jgi:hypothetical protein